MRNILFAFRAVLAALFLSSLPLLSQAQSSVQVFGTVDLNFTYSKAGGKSVRAMDQGGNIFPSRLGFRGSEDLGGGLVASFWLESALLPDTGEYQGVYWHRRSTLSLSSRTWGELRLGRDYVPTFWNVSQFSPFGTVGVGGSAAMVEGWPMGLGGARTLVRVDNSVGYFLPRDLGGFYGQAMYAMPEGAEGMRYAGARLGYAGGPLDIAAAYGRTPVANGQVYRTATVGGTYDFGPVKLYANYHRHQAFNDRQVHVMVGASMPVGPGVIKLSAARANRSGPGLDADDATQFAVGYVHWLSKRTAVYTAYSRIRNRGNAAYVVADSSPAGSPGMPSSGLQFGISHNF
ncbi:porin [Variovorax sp.]|jgi:predicted porin|uniref:porin n=1 Tax=Variovorax sp. TaxID=1871043 RepID=UPI0012068A9A|nr:porin [Variovorax sp.]TAJ58068.1 MAG: porin [Variovorax sp.]